MKLTQTDKDKIAKIVREKDNNIKNGYSLEHAYVKVYTELLKFIYSGIEEEV